MWRQPWSNVGPVTRKPRRTVPFCRYCGRSVSKQLPEERQALLARTGKIIPSDDGKNAINEYLNRWPDGPEARDVLIARQCPGVLIQLDVLPELVLYEDRAELASAIAGGLPLILSNGLV